MVERHVLGVVHLKGMVCKKQYHNDSVHDWLRERERERVRERVCVCVRQ